MTLALRLSLLLALSFPALAAAQSIASSSSTNPYPGVEIEEGRVRLADGCFANYYAAVSSLCTDHLHVDARAPASTTRTTGSWGDARGVQVAVNGDFYRYDSTDGWFVYGDAVGNGDRWPAVRTGNAHDGWWNGKYGWIAFGPGWVDFMHTKYIKDNRDAFGAAGGFRPATVTTDIRPGTQSMVSGFPELVTEGRVYTCPDPNGSCFPDRGDMADRHPRTAMGITEDRQTFLLVVVDGRAGCSGSAGMRGTELAWLMGELGAWQAFNLDGGGSSAMWVRGRGYVNEPSDGSARSVLNHWGIFAGSGSGTSVEPGSCCTAEVCNGADDDCDGAVDEGDVCAPPDAGTPDAGPADGGGGASDASVLTDAGVAGTDAGAGGVDAARADAAVGTDSVVMAGGCACRSSGGVPGAPLVLGAVLLLLSIARRRRR